MDLPDLHLRSQMRADGFTDDEVARLVREGRLTPIRRGAYVLGEPPDDTAARHTLLARAAVHNLAGGAVLSHVSAAVVHGLKIWGIGTERVHVTRARRTGGRAGSRVHVHTAPLDPDEIAVVAGLPVTSVARTVVDLARTVPFEHAVVVADAALYRKLADPEALAEALRRTARWPGSPQARRVIGFADGRSESVGESRSRVAILAAGLPKPVLQWDVTGRGGRWLGRVDFGWPALRTVGEFDGRIKYGRLLRPGQEPGDVVFEEKRREDGLRDEDLGVVRWIWPELDHFAPVAERLRRRFRWR